jgi:hypothetical protein
MAGTFANTGATVQLEAWLNNSWPASKDLTLKLFTNNFTPGTTTVVGDFTEAAGGGYSAITLSNGSWTVSSISVPRSATYAQQTFTFTGALTSSATVYGYYIVDDDNVLIAAEKVGTITPANSGDTYVCTPVITSTSA